MDEKIKEIEGRYPNTTCCNLICFAEKLQSEQRIKEFEEENKDLKFKLSCHTSTCIADYENLESQIKKLEEGIEKHKSYMWGDGIVDHPADVELYNLVEKNRKVKYAK